MRTQDEILVASLDKIKSVIPVTPSTQLYDAINTMVDEITSLHQQLAEQPNVDVLLEALLSIKEGILLDEYGNRNDDGITDFNYYAGLSLAQRNWTMVWVNTINKALATYQTKKED